MFSTLTIATKRILEGNLFFVVCCIFYLAWWLLAFKPEGAIKGIKSAWLLLPAFITGLLALFLILRGICIKTTGLLPNYVIVLGGIIGYIGLLLITSILMKRPVTTELFLIVGWVVLSFLEVNTLYGMQCLSLPWSVIFFVMLLVFAFLSVVCYVLYYRLDLRGGYFVGMVPLITASFTMMVLSLPTITTFFK